MGRGHNDAPFINLTDDEENILANADGELGAHHINNKVSFADLNNNLSFAGFTSRISLDSLLPNRRSGKIISLQTLVLPSGLTSQTECQELVTQYDIQAYEINKYISFDDFTSADQEARTEDPAEDGFPKSRS